jgi:signal transduction histidine kinase
MLWKRVGRYPRTLDALLVALLLLASVGTAGRHHSLYAIVPLAALQILPLLFRRRYPVQVFGVVLTATLLSEVTLHRPDAAPVWIALYTVASYRGRSVSLGAAGATVVVLSVPLIGGQKLGSQIPNVVLAVAAWLLGDNVRTRRAYLREIEDRAERLEREREENVRRAAQAEQARIARELHDVIAHNVSVMVVQAAAANDVFDSHPEKAREALRSIERTGRSALTELRRLLGAVRAPDQDTYAPQPGLASLPALLEGLRTAGLPVALHVDGGLDDLPAGLDLSAYRIVQEALTNTLKHAEATRAEVGVRRTDKSLELEIVDDGGGGEPSAEGSGHGLIGMRERASLVGGEVEAGPQPGGGFRVRAKLPL